MYADPALGCTPFGLNSTVWAETSKKAVLIRNIHIESVYVMYTDVLSSAHGNAKNGHFMGDLRLFSAIFSTFCRLIISAPVNIRIFKFLLRIDLGESFNFVVLRTP